MTAIGPSSFPFRGASDGVHAIEFPYRRSSDQDASTPVRHAVVGVGA